MRTPRTHGPARAPRALTSALMAGVLGLGALGTLGTAAAQSSEPAPPPASSSAAPSESPAPSEAPSESATEETEGKEESRRGEIWIPDWLLLIPAAAVIVAAVTLATKSYLRFTETRHDLEG